MFLKVYDQKGKEVEKTRVSSEIFGLKANPDLIRQVALCQRSNRRNNIAHTKGRGEVRGGGKKPWRQKGTGRARAGSIRSPLWKGGGVTFGPIKERNFKKIVPKKMRRKALFQILSAKAEKEFILVLDNLSFKKPKTKEAFEIINNLPCKEKTFLLGLPNLDKNLIKSFNNIPKGRTIQARDLNVLDLLCSKYLIITKDSIKIIEETFLNKKEKVVDKKGKKKVEKEK